MRLIKPNWVTHDGSPIFSIDIHPHSKKFATGGSGGDAGRVVIWNLEPVVDEKKEMDPNVPKMLCQLDNHYACVNCVRWNADGLLASGGDDKLIMIWKLSKFGGGSVFGSTKTNVETWKCVKTLRGHAGDILDLAWAPNNVWLASASVDNTVIIWETNSATIVRVIKGHTGLVKGVSWDPIGKYLASQSDDKTLRIWSTANFSEEKIITEPFKECGGTTHVLRLSWSPDGQYLVSAHAMNGGGSTAQIIDRNGWEVDKDYVGHRKAVTCVRFHQRILARDKKHYCVAALGSRDRSISIWSTALKRPLVVVHELFVASILDISWSQTGLCCCACSKDGTTVFIQFNHDELGEPLDPASQLKLQENIYGKQTKGKFLIIEDPSLYQEELPEPRPLEDLFKPPISSVKSNNVSSEQPSSIPKGPINKQIETKTKDGKRRITPMFIPVTPDMEEDMEKVTSSEAEKPFSSSSQAKSSIVIEKRDEVKEGPELVSVIDETPGLSEKARKILPPMSPTPTDSKQPNLSEGSDSVQPRVAQLRREADEIFPRLKPKDNLGASYGKLVLTALYKDELTLLQLCQETTASEKWYHYLGYRPTAVAVTSLLAVITLEDGSVHIFLTPRGVRAVPPIIPPAPLSRLHASGNKVMVISCNGEVRVWEVKGAYDCKITIKTNASHLVAPKSSLYACQLHNGMPFLVFSSNRAYVYSKDMETWMLIGDSEDPIWRWASLTSLGKLAGERKPADGTLAQLQEGLNTLNGKHVPKLKFSSGAETLVSYYGLQALTARALGSSLEFGYWTNVYVNYLCTHDETDKRIRIVLDELLGPSHSMAHLSNWDPKILDLEKHKLLREVMHIIKQHPRWQRLYIEYNEQLEFVSKLRAEHVNGDTKNSQAENEIKV
ncbi:protein HIRA homolog [Trichogramma pretiosum]|uniref:protein HIRA homolog n=1 Tax=Trichogramma pretiosum TaxID=7493 RepID=UPI0006C9AEF8|nr:protein HIRA homolog [Trichogramma pretiosum]